MSKAQYEIVLLPGDGIGPEVVDAAVSGLKAAAGNEGLEPNHTTYEAGAGLYQRTGKSMSEADAVAVGEADAVLLVPWVCRPFAKPMAPRLRPKSICANAMACSRACVRVNCS